MKKLRSPQVVVRLATGVLFAASWTYLAGFRGGWAGARPEVLAALVAALCLSAAAMLTLALRAAAAGPRRLSSTAEAMAALGLLLAAGGGFVNWARDVQGAVVLFERQPVRLADSASLEASSRGPLADARDLDVTVALARLELEPAGAAGGFRAVSRLRFLDATGEEEGLTVARGAVARRGALVLRQGAFGFAPRILVARGGQTLLDTHVPFRSVREGEEGISFLGSFEIERERLTFQAALTLQELSDEMKGHPRLEIAVLRDGQALGRGTLAPGEVAEVEGLRIGFYGLQRWSEIDFSRVTHRWPVLAGAALLGLGLLAWPVAAWRRR